jgi:CHAD domain-containing protein
LTLQAKRTFSLADLPGEPLEPRLFEITSFDTPDRRLDAADVTLQRRVENGRSRWSLELRAGEHAVTADGGPVPPAKVTAPLATLLADRELQPVKKLRTRRRGRLVRRNGHVVARVLSDDVAALEPRGVGFAKVHIEPVDGDRRELESLGKAVRKAGARAAKAMLPATEPRPVTDDARVVVAWALRTTLRALFRHEPGARLGLPEDVHQMRVAVRRSRAYVRAARLLYQPDWVTAVQADLRWLGQELGSVRDLDVLIAHLESEVTALDDDARPAAPLLKRLRGERTRAHDKLMAVLDGERYAALLGGLEEGPPSSGSAAEPSLRELVLAEVTRLRDGHLEDDASAEELHEFRIRAKRARYAAELLPADEPAAKRMVRRAKQLQDVLGKHQDAVVAEARLRGLLRPQHAPSTVLAVGRLVERERERRLSARRALPRSLRRVARAQTKLRA